MQVKVKMPHGASAEVPRDVMRAILDAAERDGRAMSIGRFVTGSERREMLGTVVRLRLLLEGVPVPPRAPAIAPEPRCEAERRADEAVLRVMGIEVCPIPGADEDEEVTTC